VTDLVLKSLLDLEKRAEHRGIGEYVADSLDEAALSTREIDGVGQGPGDTREGSSGDDVWPGEGQVTAVPTGAEDDRR